MYNIKFNSRCYKELKRLPKITSSRILKKISGLKNEAVPHDAKRIVSVKGKMFRIRVGDYRVLYVINYENNEIYISIFNPCLC